MTYYVTYCYVRLISQDAKIAVFQRPSDARLFIFHTMHAKIWHPRIIFQP